MIQVTKQCQAADRDLSTGPKDRAVLAAVELLGTLGDARRDAQLDGDPFHDEILCL